MAICCDRGGISNRALDADPEVISLYMPSGSTRYCYPHTIHSECPVALKDRDSQILSPVAKQGKEEGEEGGRGSVPREFHLPSAQLWPFLQPPSPGAAPALALLWLCLWRPSLCGPPHPFLPLPWQHSASPPLQLHSSLLEPEPPDCSVWQLIHPALLQACNLRFRHDQDHESLYESIS